MCGKNTKTKGLDDSRMSVSEKKNKYNFETNETPLIMIIHASINFLSIFSRAPEQRSIMNQGARKLHIESAIIYSCVRVYIQYPRTMYTEYKNKRKKKIRR